MEDIQLGVDDEGPLCTSSSSQEKKGSEITRHEFDGAARVEAGDVACASSTGNSSPSIADWFSPDPSICRSTPSSGASGRNGTKAHGKVKRRGQSNKQFTEQVPVLTPEQRADRIVSCLHVIRARMAALLDEKGMVVLSNVITLDPHLKALSLTHARLTKRYPNGLRRTLSNAIKASTVPMAYNIDDNDATVKGLWRFQWIY